MFLSCNCTPLACWFSAVLSAVSMRLVLHPQREGNENLRRNVCNYFLFPSFFPVCGGSAGKYSLAGLHLPHVHRPEEARADFAIRRVKGERMQHARSYTPFSAPHPARHLLHTLPYTPSLTRSLLHALFQALSSTPSLPRPLLCTHPYTPSLLHALFQALPSAPSLARPLPRPLTVKHVLSELFVHIATFHRRFPHTSPTCRSM